MAEEKDRLEFAARVHLAFQEEGEYESFKKGQYLTREGEVERKLFFIESGAVKIYFLSEMGEKIIRLGYDGSILNSLSSFFTQAPSDLYIEAIRETKVKYLTKGKVAELIANSSQYPQFLESLLIQQLERELDLLHDSPSLRLERVLARSPHLFQHIPLKYIASYLRMSPETLSRIRKAWFKSRTRGLKGWIFA